MEVSRRHGERHSSVFVFVSIPVVPNTAEFIAVAHANAIVASFAVGTWRREHEHIAEIIEWKQSVAIFFKFVVAGTRGVRDMHVQVGRCGVSESQSGGFDGSWKY